MKNYCFKVLCVDAVPYEHESRFKPLRVASRDIGALLEKLNTALSSHPHAHLTLHKRTGSAVVISSTGPLTLVLEDYEERNIFQRQGQPLTFNRGIRALLRYDDSKLPESTVPTIHEVVCSHYKGKESEK